MENFTNGLLTLADIVSGAKKIPNNIKGIYFLIREGQIVFIGKTINYFFRIGQHLQDKKISNFFFLPLDITDDEIDALERRYIDQYLPSFNTHKKFYQSAPKNSEKPRVDQAIDLMNSGFSGYAAAKAVGITVGGFYRTKKYKNLRDNLKKQSTQ